MTTVGMIEAATKHQRDLARRISEPRIAEIVQGMATDRQRLTTAAETFDNLAKWQVQESGRGHCHDTASPDYAGAAFQSSLAMAREELAKEILERATQV